MAFCVRSKFVSHHGLNLTKMMFQAWVAQSVSESTETPACFEKELLIRAWYAVLIIADHWAISAARSFVHFG
jgi:hypothetical protein